MPIDLHGCTIYYAYSRLKGNGCPKLCTLRVSGCPAEGVRFLVCRVFHASRYRKGLAHFYAPLGQKDWCSMKNLFLALAFVGACGVGLADERTVVVPRDDKPFAVEKTDLVRLTGKGIAGSKIEVKVDGPAKLEATSNVRELVNGRPIIGNSVKEFDLKATDTGKVTVTITVTPPQPDAQAKVTKIEFEVK
jgi:hypothetical protein